ncbi:MAG: hypothetical protein EXR67_05905 [Dehalococcoidia bacterium]|nr:hypothetical protein [Dehalococcoidia bacterium]
MGKRTLGLFVGGAALGLAAGILATPYSGKENRVLIRRKASLARRAVRSRLRPGRTENAQEKAA